MRKPPCKDCPRRTAHPNCHDRCEDYRQWKAEQAEATERRRKDLEHYAYNRAKTQRLYNLMGKNKEGQK